jgi:hypothetical protein
MSSPGVAPEPDGRGPRLVAEVLDPVLGPLGFAPGQVGVSGSAGQVTFCRGTTHSSDGACVDLVLDVVATPGWRITGVHYWGFPSDRWHLDFDREAALGDQLTGLARSLPDQLEQRG